MNDYERTLPSLRDMKPNEVANVVLHWVEHKIPGCVVRFGEGEGRLMVADANDQLSVDIARRKIKRQTGQSVSAEAALSLGADILIALDRADIVGVRGDEKFNEEHMGWVRRIERVVEGRLQYRSKNGIITHCLVNANISDRLNNILHHADFITVVSCRDIEGTVSRLANEANIRMIQIPSQFVKREIDDEYERRLHATPMWPSIYNYLNRDLNVRSPGEVFLVGAGLFGKLLCTRLRDEGGIALDLGSRLDLLAGKRTRNGAPTRFDPNEKPRRP